MKHSIHAVALFLSLFFVPAAHAQVDCGTTLETLDPGDFKFWIETIQQDACAEQSLAEYAGLGSADATGDVLAAPDAYRAAIGAFLQIIATAPLDAAIVARIEALALQTDSASDFDPVLFSLSVPRGAPPRIGGTIQINGSNIERYASYVEHCVATPNVDACARWEKTVRLLAAMNYLTAAYRQAIVDTELTRYSLSLDSYIDQWENYFERRKPQLPWEIALNQIMNRDLRRADYFARPPSSDLILLHPMLVYSRVSDAADGEQDQAALAIELIGFNRWQKKFSGASLVAINSDRASIDDTGYGVMLHFGSHYSLGWSRHDDEDGWFFSIDLLNAVDDKRSLLEARRAEALQKFEQLKSRLEQTGN